MAHYIFSYHHHYIDQGCSFESASLSLDHHKSHYFDQKGKLQLWVAIFLRTSEMISPDLFVCFLPFCQLFCNFHSFQFKKKCLWLRFLVKYNSGFKDICADCNLWGSL